MKMRRMLKALLQPRRIAAAAFIALVAFAPAGTRIIFRQGMMDGWAVEPGTISLFATQLLALVFVVSAFVMAGRRNIAALLRRPEAAAAVAIAALALLSVLSSGDRPASLASAAGVALAAFVFLAILLFRPEPYEALGALFGGAIFQILFGLPQFLAQTAPASTWLGMAAHSAADAGTFVVETLSGRWLRAYGALAHPNIYGIYVALGIIAAVGLAAYYGVHPAGAGRDKGLPSHWRHLRFFAFMPVITAGLFVAFSRSAVLALAAALLWMAVAAYLTKAAPTFKTVMLPSLLIVLATFVALGTVFAEPLLTRIEAKGRLEQQSLDERTTQIADASALLATHPLLGVGIGRMPQAVAEEVDPGRPWWRYQEVHNVPLLVAVETGIGGMLAWLAVAAATLAVAGRRLGVPANFSTGVTVYAACFIALLVSAAFDHFLWSSWFGQLMFWIVAGLVHASFGKLEKGSSLA